MVMFKDIAALPLDCRTLATVCSGTSCLVPPPDEKAIVNTVLDALLTTMTAFVIFSMGCTVELHNLLGHLRRPWGIFIGFLCQFGIMPFTGFALSLAFNVAPLYAVVIIIMGCCPGGSASNIVSYYLDGDMDLSVGMTTCSTILAMGMMPLCLLIYTSLWVSPETILIPYNRIGFTLVTFLIPIAIGMCVKRKWPKAAKKILKIGSITGYVLLGFLSVVAGVVYKSSWDMDPEIWIIGALFPFIGSGLGFLLAWLVGQPWFRCRTIAVETGFQNIGLCNTIVQLSFSPAEVEVMFSFPLIYSLFEVVVGIFIVGGYYSYKRTCGGGRPPLEDGEAEPKQEQKGLENSGFEPSENIVVRSQDCGENA